MSSFGDHKSKRGSMRQRGKLKELARSALAKAFGRSIQSDVRMPELQAALPPEHYLPVDHARDIAGRIESAIARMGPDRDWSSGEIVALTHFQGLPTAADIVNSILEAHAGRLKRCQGERWRLGENSPHVT